MNITISLCNLYCL